MKFSRQLPLQASGIVAQLLRRCRMLACACSGQHHAHAAASMVRRLKSINSKRLEIGKPRYIAVGGVR